MLAIKALLQPIAAHRNSLVVASTLGPDVLLLIFEAYRDDTSGEQQVDYHASCGDGSTQPIVCSRRSSTNNPLGWIACSQVCQHWRRVALSTPSLWKDVSLHLGLMWTKTSLYRARSTPGIHMFGCIDERYGEFTRGAPNFLNFSHVSMLSIYVPRTMLANFLRTLLRQKVALQKIVLSERFDEDRPSILVLPLALASPGIQRISLENVILQWRPLPFTAHLLTRIDVLLGDRFASNDADPLFSARGAVRFLRSAPALEVLRLRNAFPNFGADDDVLEGSYEIAELPHLRELDLALDELNSHYLISHTSFPPLRRIRLYLPEARVAVNEARITYLIQRALQHPYPGSQAPGDGGTLWWSQGLCATDRLRLIIHSTHLVRDPLGEHSDSEIYDSDVDIVLCFSTSASCPELARAVCNALPPLFVETLIVTCASKAVWRVFARRLPHVRYISTPDDGLIGVDLPRPWFPKLTSLDLHSDLLGDDVNSLAVQTFLGELRKRKSAGRPLQRFIVNRYSRAPAWMDAARELVERIQEGRDVR
ncbi:hypothetical protein BC834DRAFT_236808 [Gloeopeniophorella convolvens]|nr:hypothetical protein BC834DRAFT_236808 [Gloeopeniophorella convolvens]